MTVAPRYVVLHRGRWYVTGLAGTAPSPIDLADVLVLVADDQPPPAPSAAGDATGDADLLESTWFFCGELVDGRVIVSDHDGTVHRLDGGDLRLLGALTSPSTPASAAEAAGMTEAEGSVRIAALGARFLRQHLGAPAPIAAPEAPEAPEVAPMAVAGPPGRIPVYAIWHEAVGPSLSLGMLTAAARHHDGGRLNEVFEIRPPERSDHVLDHLRSGEGPAVLLCSDYVWSLDDNLRAAREAREARPGTIVVHGGPSSPKYPGDAEAFLRANRDAADVLVRGEGELVLCDLLDALATSLPAIDAAALRGIPGLSFLDPDDDSFVQTPDQARIADLDVLPSPYLTGEFDHIPIESWHHCLSIETNRGCPYGCSFCDWGSSTLSRIRKFSLDRVAAELEWVARRRAWSLNVTDANFGIMSRDVDIAHTIVEVAQRNDGYPRLVSYYPAKNTTKHLARIMDVLVEGGVGPAATLSLQTTDPTTLTAIDRANISTDHYVALTAEFRRRGLPVQGDLLLGLPGQTYDSYRRDLQYHIDHEVTPRTWQVRVLPNAPMNEPSYRARHRIEVDAAHRVTSTSSFDATARARMVRLRTFEAIAERFGLLRHVMRFLQWDHGVEATSLLDRLIDVVGERPEDHPALAWTFGHFDLFHGPAVGWGPFYAELRRFLADEHPTAVGPALDTVLAVQHALMPETGRRFPCTVRLEHDYVGYYRSATASLWGDGGASGPDRPLDRWGPAELTVTGDPLGLCDEGVSIVGDPRDELFENDFIIGANSAYELTSPLMRLLPHVAFAAREDYERAVSRPALAPVPVTPTRS